ncbi:MAG TPA: choice-of-anchor Q domain-containing protein [Dokdonella sp.]|uniref:choice-of-anchor Q domain-containing protein n=1 Tax=Dokdonella sp. TaxID=2291710 RepID=UPI0025C31088|nr:choice-of-anchor Q domain-containing protein [Dokdonella sp.]MBX3691838.1 hypothetical protein [Dokdonella sp.]HNR92879.1 choice-of-anchor Q domain-containing protein [Dokdonella sp.]
MNRIIPICLAVLSSLAVPARAATFNVTSLADSGAGSLRAAIEQANGAAGAPHVVAFQPGLTGTIALASELRITNSMTIAGPGAYLLTLDGGNATRLLRVERTGGSPRIVVISGLTLARGRAESGAAILGYDDDLSVIATIFSDNEATYRGGAIHFSEADLDLDSVILTNNRAPSTGQGAGGAIQFSAGTLTIARSYLAGNSANFGGAVRISSPRARALITDTLFQDNTAAHTGGAIDAGTMSAFRVSGSAFVGNSTGEPYGGAINYAGSNDASADGSIIENTTFSANVTRHPAGVASALAISGGHTILRNSTFAANRVAPLSANPAPRNGALWVASTGTTVDIVSTLFDDNTSGTAATPNDLAHESSSPSNPSIVNASDSLFRTMPGAVEINGTNQRNQFATVAQLKPLTTTDGGGFVPVHPLARTSPAIDRGANPGTLAWDQRGTGFARAWSDPAYRNDPVNSKADIGAYEFRGDAFFHGDFEQR